MPGKLLFIGDVHLGRRPLRVPDDRDASTLGPTEGWRRSVKLALREKVAAVVFAGDVVESIENRFEAERILRPGIEELRAAGIRVLAVVGNHDVKALPRLARRVEGFELVGVGAWESVVIEAEGAPLCRLHGWSFDEHEPIVRENPLESLPDEAVDASLPNLGVLHCDRDAATSSPYAPVPSNSFSRGAAAKIDAWLLGHVHRPDHAGLRADRPLGYLGSLVALDGGEPGAHGPWLVSVEGKGRIRAEQVLVGPIRWEELEIDIDDLEVDEADDRVGTLRSEILTTLETTLAGLGSEADRLSALALRIRLVGRVDQPEAWRRAATKLAGNSSDLVTTVGDVLLYCDKLETQLLPRIDLGDLAGQRGATAALARLLMEPDESLGAGLTTHLENLLESSTWLGLDDVEDVASSERIHAAGLELLGRMLAQREVSS